MAEQEGLAQEIAAAIDSGQGLSDQQYKALLDSLREAGQPDVLPLHERVNLPVPPAGGGGGPAGPRIVLVSSNAAAATLPALIEEHLIATHANTSSRRGVVLVQPEALQALKRRRSASLPDSITYDGKSFGGR